MSIDYAHARYAPRPDLVSAHADAWTRIGGAGAVFDGRVRRAIAAATRAAQRCELCGARRDAVSPFAIEGAHDGGGELPAGLIDVVHRLATDPGRLTRRWFDGIIASGLSQSEYVEAVSVVTTTVVIDGMHRALGLAPPALPDVAAGTPHGRVDPRARDEGAWVPMVPRPSEEATDTGMPSVPNIGRAMSLVPDAPALFFRAFTPHYRLKGLDFAIDRPEIEFVASRVSALNQCFY